MPFRNNYNQKSLSKDVIHGIEKRYNFIFNSVNGTLLSNIANDKSQFNVTFHNPIFIPDDASSVSVALHSANIVNSVQNITDTLYNTITFIVEGSQQTLTLPSGSYSLCDIQTTINELLALAYTAVSPLPEIKILANSATQKVSIQFLRANMQIDWSNSSIKFILGFDTNDIQPTNPSTLNQIIEANSIARVNWAITNFLIVCPQLCGDGLPLNSQGRGILGGIPIIAKPGSLISYEAINPLWIQADVLIGKAISSLDFKLVNERVQEIVMTEDFNFVVVLKIHY